MSFIGDAIGSVVGGITGSKQSSKAAQQAAQTQANTATQAIAEQRAARESAQGLQKPYVDAGGEALAQQMALIGLNGTTGQQTAVSALLSSPEYTSTVRAGEEAILQNAAATGGLRGGNTQNSLARFRADLIPALINQQFNRLGGITSIGQNAAAGTGNAGLGVANSISDLLNQQGAALAGGQIARGNLVRTTFNDGLQLAKTFAGGF